MARRRNNRPLLAVTMGDPAGIGPEVILKAAASNPQAHIVVVGDLAAMSEAAARLRLAKPTPWSGEMPSTAIQVLETSELGSRARRPGKPTAEGADASFRYVEAGVRMAREGAVDALVTAPVSKEWWHRAGHRFPGHTELLAKLAGVKKYRMMFAGSELRLALVTVHVALSKVPRLLTRDRVYETIDLLHRHLEHIEGASRPRIGVLGFNPHAGEAGLFGTEEQSAIAPAIEKARREGIDAHGPLPPDTAFARPGGKFGFDAAVAMYHDQGLIPLKTLEFDRAVNVTIGLPFVRTSPDHGTAFDIAGRSVANPSSMLAAIEYATRAARSRSAMARRAA